MRNRATLLSPGSPLGDHYTVLNWAGRAEGREFYVASDVRPDRPQRVCWACGHLGTPRQAATCERCSASLEERWFLVSARSGAPERLRAWLAFLDLQLTHPGLAPTVDAFVQDGVLFSVTPYTGGLPFFEESAPATALRLLEVALRIVGTLAYLRRHGVRLGRLQAANLLPDATGVVQLFDFDVEEVHADGPAPQGLAADILRPLAGLLLGWHDPEASALIHLARAAEDGAFAELREFGGAIESRFEERLQVTNPGLIGGMTDLGLKRELNEDNYGCVRISPRAVLYAVADGMGGHDSGEVASALAVRTVCDVAFERGRGAETDEDFEQLLSVAVQAANERIKDTADERGTDMGTTLVCALILDDRLGIVANVGDSRAYLMRHDALRQISLDHSLVQKLVDRGHITADEARVHPHSNILLRTVGTEHDIEVDLFRVSLAAGDRVLLCSDGLWNEVEDAHIEAQLASCSDARVACGRLVRAAHQAGAKDNITVIIVTIPEA